MYAITGITGQVGGAMARALLIADKTFALLFAISRKADPGPRRAARSSSQTWKMPRPSPRHSKALTASSSCRRLNSTHYPAIPRLFA